LVSCIGSEIVRICEQGAVLIIAVPV